jgi:endo-1,4-beta-xylanase
LWSAAAHQGLAFGSSTSTWQLADHAYRALFTRQAALLFTEDDLLWYRIRPSPTSGLHFARADRIISFARQARQLPIGAHLVWDQGFGPGWADGRRLWKLPRPEARRLLDSTVTAVVSRYRGQVPVWSTVNEAIAASRESSADGLRTDVPWFRAAGPDYVSRGFWLAHRADPAAMLMLNDNGFETTDPYGNDPRVKRAHALRVVDTLLAQGVPVHAFGVQAHLYARQFTTRFDPAGYRRFLHALADRGLRILITELDVLDDGLPAAIRPRDRAVADVYRRYLDCALSVDAVCAVLTFGLSDRYTWLDQDDPRADGAPRRPLPFDARLHTAPAFESLWRSLAAAPLRRPVLSLDRRANRLAAASCRR